MPVSGTCKGGSNIFGPADPLSRPTGRMHSQPSLCHIKVTVSALHRPLAGKGLSGGRFIAR